MQTQAELVRARREERGLSRNALARLMGKSPSFLAQVERGERRLTTVETVERAASALHLPADDLHRAAGKLPPDILAFLLANPKVWSSIRQVMRRGT